MTELSSEGHSQVMFAALGSRAGRQMRILVIEDEPRILAFLARGLEAEGFTVDGAPDGRAGVQQATRGRYDLVILDLLLPKLDGLAVLHEGEVVTRESLLADVWGYHFDPRSNVVDVCIRRLRQKLGAKAPIETVRHGGYRLTAA